MKRFLSICLVALACLVLYSCSSREESAISDMTDLNEKVENAKDPQSLDWDELDNEYEEIEQQAAECNFSKEQSDEYYRQQGKYQAARIKYTLKNLPDAIGNAINAASSYAKGLMEGLSDDSVK